jgi:hypothetical protein
MVSQGLLFSEPSVAETGVWCALADGIDPAQWASICRYIGSRRPQEFQYIKNLIIPKLHCKNEHQSHNDKPSPLPLVSIGPSGLGGQYQHEHF